MAVTSFVGRERETAEVRRLLSTSRLVTLTGPGGVGKTRLAARVAEREARTFPGGVAFVELAELRDAALVPHLVADRLGLRHLGDAPVSRAIADHLRDRATLVVLDNCEHLIDACAELAAALLTGTRRAVLLATSRQTLQVPGEWVVPVEPLPIEDAVRLFRERAAAVWPGSVDASAPPDGPGRGPGAGPGPADDQRVLTELCLRLDGLPLAIEMAAARVRSLSPEQITDRLADRFRLLTSGPRTVPPRQRTLRATLDWSFELCTPQERRAWARLSVFAGSFGLDAAERVCADPEPAGADGIDAGDVLALIDSLLDKSVLVRREQAGGVRYRMLQTVREYGRERLCRDGEEDRVAGLHRQWYDELTEEAERDWVSDRQLELVGRLREELPDLRAALARSLSRPDEAGAALRMAARLPEFWLLRGLPGEARTWLERALAAAPPGDPDRALALCRCALYVLWQGDLEKVENLLVQAESLVPDGSPVTGSIAHVRAFAALLTAQPGTVALADTACAIFREHGYLRDELHPLFVHGVAVAYMDGDPVAARRSLVRMNEVCTAAGDLFYQAMSLFGRAIVEVEFGDAGTAREAATAALRLDLQTGDEHGLAYRLDALAWVADRQGEHVRAATLFGISDAFWDRIGTTADFAAGLPHQVHIGRCREALGDARFEQAFATGRAMSRDDALHFALTEPEPTAAGTADAYAGSGDPEPATALTDRERQIAGFVAEGLTSRAIAEKLTISTRTVDTHVQNILTKTGFGNRAQIAAWIVRGDQQPTR
ncbi:LuxR C-terminal-related transcriptional regulator [Actinomadura rupiterrae]|uniref:LuxR C-terminal-related transcriptional regulator n=1 Tax=Actinomadura rupiterrae TaxID=559627 RepID=UPI0020A58827|nr:LuxR C-terminal-related transcriptional regulator [Actinomadura rupiterrae]MCP2342426.1 non-specific serine/threonine protein kinase [Actinomadura rupiterrae]